MGQEISTELTHLHYPLSRPSSLTLILSGQVLIRNSYPLQPIQFSLYCHYSRGLYKQGTKYDSLAGMTPRK